MPSSNAPFLSYITFDAGKDSSSTTFVHHAYFVGSSDRKIIKQNHATEGGVT